MTRIYDPNLAKAGASDDWAGRYLFALKELAVSAGYTVVGSGDGDSRFAYDGQTGALPGAQQGSGGSYDCWLTGASRSDSAPAVAGDAGNADAWCVIEDPGGRQVLLVMTSQGGSNWSGYCRIAVARAGAGGFDGSAAAASTIPGTPSGGAGDERWAFGTRASASGVQVFLYAETGRIHMYADDTGGAVDGGLPLGFLAIDSSFNVEAYFAVVPMDEASSEDADPCVYLAAASATAYEGFGWKWASGPTYPDADLNSQNVNNFWDNAGASDPISGDDPIICPIYVLDGSPEVWKGVPHETSPRMSAVNRGWGDRGDDQNGVSWVATGVSGMMFPWPDTATVPLP